MPWRSRRQSRWGNSPTGRREMGASKVREFNDATDWLVLPEEVGKKKKKRKGPKVARLRP
jgi:hypothetical protein